MPIALTSYSVVLALHIIAVIAAFGLPLAYPVLMPYVRRHHPRAMPGLHDVQHRLNQRLTAPGTVLILIFGAYLASKGHLWSKLWVDVPLAILVVIGGLGGAVVVPASRRLAELARADVDSTASGAEVSFGPEYARVYQRYMAVEITLAALSSRRSSSWPPSRSDRRRSAPNLILVRLPCVASSKWRHSTQVQRRLRPPYQGAS